MMWTTETPGDRQTTMQVAMAEARSRKYAASVLSLKPITAAFKEMARLVGEALVQIGRAFQQFGEAIARMVRAPSARPVRPSLPSFFETSGLGFTSRGRGFSPVPPRWC